MRVVFIVTMFGTLNANSVESDNTQRSVASDLGLHYLPMFLYGDARYKWFQLKDVRKMTPFLALASSVSITKTYLYNFDPLKPHFIQ